MNMKKIAIGLLTLAAMVQCAPVSWALFMNSCCGRRCCGGKYTAVICCRQYNAFTPVCFGNITGIGCCPMNMCGGSCMPPYMGCQPSCGPSMSCGSCCDSGSCYTSSTKLVPAPGNFTPPPPNLVPGQVSYWNPPAPYMGQPYNIQQTSHYPGYQGYYPYYPGYYQPTMPYAVPNYWYGR